MNTFRIRFCFYISHKGMIRGDTEKFEFNLPNGKTASLHSIGANCFSDATKFEILSGGYSTEQEAYTIAYQIKDAALYFGAKFRLGIDIGKEKASSFLSDYSKNEMFNKTKRKIIEDVHGVSVYSEKHPTSIYSSSVVGLVCPQESSFFIDEICKRLVNHKDLDNRIKLSMELLTSSYFESSQRARFLTLVLSAESILTPEGRSEEVTRLIDSFREQSKSAEITEKERQSISGSLNWLYKDSISQSLQKMALKHLAGKQYDNLSPNEFIKKCYEARSKLVHTGSVQESKYNLGTLAANLELYMSDMLTKLANI